MILYIYPLASNKKRPLRVFLNIGMTGFEPAAPSSRTKCATKLRYIPIQIFNYQFRAQLGIFSIRLLRTCGSLLACPIPQCATGTLQDKDPATSRYKYSIIIFFYTIIVPLEFSNSITIVIYF